MSIVKPFANNTLATFAYEPFSYTISNPGSYTLTVSNSSGIPPGYIVNAGTEVIFSTPSNGMISGANQEFVITATGNTPPTSTNSVTVGPGRFLDSSGNSFVGQSFSFFKSEPITPITLVAPLGISTPTSVPTLPPGLTYTSNASNIYSITGTPLVTVPQSNYLVIGKGIGSNLGKIMTSQFGLSVSNERIQMNLTGSPIVSPMTVGTPISQRILTSQYPPYPSGGTLRYTWSGLPDGITVADSLGTTRTSPFTPTDSLATLTIQGTPTLAAANAYANAGITSNVVSFTATRTNPLPQLSNATAVTFGFGETVLFDSVTVPTLYSGVTLDPSATFFRAQTYFGSGSGIASILSPDLRADLSLNFVPATGRAYLTSIPGGPGATGTASYTIRATNSNAIGRDIIVPITVTADTVSFVSPTPAIDTCYNFVISRPISLDLSGYYTSPIEFSATAASGANLNWSAPALAGTGLSLSPTTGSTVKLVGTPTTVTALQSVPVTATTATLSATATRTIKIEVVQDQFTFASLGPFTFIQNKAIDAIQVSATTLSGRPVTSYSAVGLPPGIAISSVGQITGTPTADGSSTATITASTGFASSTTTISMTVLKDNILIVMANSSETVTPAFSGVEFRALTYSGKEGVLTTSFDSQAPYQGSNFTTSFVSGTSLQGDFSIVPVLLPEYRFGITGTAGSYITTAEVHAVTNNAPTIARNRIELTNLSAQQGFPNPIPQLGTIQLVRSTTTPLSFPNTLGFTVVSNALTWSTIATVSNIPYGVHDVAQNGSVLVSTAGNDLLRSVDAGASWTQVPSSNIQALDVSGGPAFLGTYYPPSTVFGCIATNGSSNWLALAMGTGSGGSGPSNTILRQSSDNGVTWMDTSTSTILPITRTTKLFYTSGRYFLLDGQSNATNPLLYADASNLSTWIAPSGFIGSVLRDLGTSNSTLIVAGDDANFPNPASTCFVSSNSGTTWAPLFPQPFPGPYSDLEITSVKYAYGRWVIGARVDGFISTAESTDLSNWTVTSGQPGTPTSLVEDGGAWQLGGRSGWTTGLWTSNGVTWSSSTSGPTPLYGSKRMTSTSVSTGSPTLTMSIPYDPSGIAFVSPTQTSYVNWQFVPIAPITVQATPSQFLYYYASGLPIGLTFVTDPSGLSAQITGTSAHYSDARQSVLLYAASGSNVAAKILDMRTILPSVVRQQTSAGSWTSLVRQYTVVNAAQNSVNGKTLPATEPTLGEFTRPEPPDSVSAPGDPNCVKC